MRHSVATLIAVAAAATIAGCGMRAHSQQTETVPVHLAITTARRAITIGYSVDHRPIRAILVGNSHAQHVVLVVGVIHGNEPAGLAITRKLANGQQVPGVALWVVPELNPDGVAADTRQNAHGVDLNRNFPYRWQPLGVPGDLQYSGPNALSEPEARAGRRFILRIRPRLSIWFHQPLALVDLSGGDPAIERRFAAAVGGHTLQLPRYPGSAVGWENHQFPGTTAFVVELPPGRLSAPATARYVRAIKSIAQTAG